MDKNGKLYITGHDGMVGTALTAELRKRGYSNILTRHYTELDLTRQSDAEAFFTAERPDYVISLAARVGGIQANVSYPAEFLYQNLMINSNVIHSAYKAGVKKLLFLGSSCIYPRVCPQPMKEEYLLTGELEPTNEGYALSKIAGLKMCSYYHQQYGVEFISLMPSNLYGPGDNFSLAHSHVVPALIRKFHDALQAGAEEVTVWGSGNPRRELLFVEDLADAIVYFMENGTRSEMGDFVNIGTGEDVSIRELAEIIGETVGYEGELVFDASKPDGMMKKCLDVSRAHSLGWKHKISLKEGIRKTYDWFLANQDNIRK